MLDNNNNHRTKEDHLHLSADAMISNKVNSMIEGSSKTCARSDARSTNAIAENMNKREIAG